MKKQHMLMAGALLVAAELAFFGDKTPASGIAEPVTRASKTTSAHVVTNAVTTTAPSAQRKDAAPRETTILTLQARETLIGGATAAKPDAALFASQSWTPPPPPPPKALPPPPPTAPPLPFTYLGKKLEDNIHEVYLARGEQTYIVREQSVIEGTYRVDAIKPPQLTLTYLPLNQVQTLTIGGSD